MIAEDLSVLILRYRISDGIITYANESCCEYFGWGEQGFAGRSYREIISGSEWEDARARLSDLGSSVSRVVFDNISLTSEGRRWQRWSCRIVPGAGGGELEVLCLGEDITGHKWVENELRKSEERYRAIFENTGTATIIIEEDTTISLANSLFEQLSGYSRGALEGKMSWTRFIVEEDLELMENYHRMRRDDPDSAPREYEFRFRNSAGEVRDIYLNIRMIPGGRQSVASCLDITDRKRAEEDLRRSEEKYRSILENMDDAYYEVDLAGTLTFVNPLR
jgi:PAS domain S-box-containing protein